MAHRARKRRTRLFLLTPLREGRRPRGVLRGVIRNISTHAPAGGATKACHRLHVLIRNFYSRPCGRGDHRPHQRPQRRERFLLTPLREGRQAAPFPFTFLEIFLLTPLREGRRRLHGRRTWTRLYFYSRPCGRGDKTLQPEQLKAVLFLLTPLREGRLFHRRSREPWRVFLLTPLREGRHGSNHQNRRNADHFYSRPCGRGDAYPVRHNPP